MSRQPAQLRDELCQSLEGLIELLEPVEASHWVDWMRSDLHRLRAGDTYAVRHVLQAFGGMGSLSDLVIDPANGHPVSEREASRLNGRLGTLRDQAYHRAAELERLLGQG